MRVQKTKYPKNNKIVEAYKEFFALIVLHPIMCCALYFLFVEGTIVQTVISVNPLDILSGVTVTMLLHSLLAIRFRDLDKSQNNLAFWDYAAAFVMLIFGLAYSTIFAYVAHSAGPSIYMLLTLVVATIISLIGFSLVSSQKMMLAFNLPVVTSVCAVLVLTKTNTAYAYTAFLATYTILMVILTRRLSSQNADRLLARDKARYLQAKMTLTEAKMKGLVTTDKATGLYTRKFFDKSYAVEFRRAKRSSTPLSVLLAEIDYFAEYDECYGSEKAIKMHNAIANMLKSKTQRAGEFVAIYNSRSFAILLPNITAEDADKFGKVIQKTVASANIPHKVARNPNLACVTVSIGIGELTKSGLVSRNGLIKQAEETLKTSNMLNASLEDQGVNTFEFGRNKV